MSSTNNVQILPKIDAGIIIAIVTCFAYLIPFVYQVVYCDNFNIPKSLITVDLNTMLIYWASALGGIIFFSGIMYFSATIGNSNIIGNAGLRYFIAKTIVLAGAAVTAKFLSMGIPGENYAILTFLVFGFIIISIRTYKLRSTYDGRDAENDNIANLTATERSELISENVNLARKSVYIFIFIVFVMAIGCTMILANNNARKETKFYVLHNRPNVLVIKMYEDRLLCKIYNPDNCKLTDQLVIVKISDNSPLELDYKAFPTIGGLEYRAGKGQCPVSRVKKTKLIRPNTDSVSNK